MGNFVEQVAGGINSVANNIEPGELFEDLRVGWGNGAVLEEVLVDFPASVEGFGEDGRF